MSAVYRGQARFRKRQRARLLAIPIGIRPVYGRTPFTRLATVEKIEVQGECWIWTGALNGAGYGRVGNRYTHRAVYEILRGLIPAGLTIDHVRERCTSRACCNPGHLELVTQLENTARVPKPSRCPVGHDLTALGATYLRPDAGPLARGVCRKCRNQRRSEFRARRHY